jgi:hypothetical protein
MIQRIQSVYFLLMVLVSVLMFVVPIAHFETAEGVVRWNVGGYDNPVLLGEMSISYSKMPGILVVVSAVVSMLALLMYRQRPMQIRICRINMIVIILFIASLFYVAHGTGESIAVVRYAYLPWAYLSLLLPVFNYLALGAIRRDERKVRAADRLR